MSINCEPNTRSKLSEIVKSGANFKNFLKTMCVLVSISFGIAIR